jgi:hypothetical protein
MCGRFTQHYTWREIHDLYGHSLLAIFSSAPSACIVIQRVYIHQQISSET